MTNGDRIESLEQQIRTLKLMLFGVFGVIGVVGLLAATTLQKVPDVIQARSFEAVDDKGNAYAVITNDASGPWIGILHEAGGIAVMTANDTGGLLMINDKNGKSNASVASNSDGGAVTVYNNEGIVVRTVGVDADGNGSVKTTSNKGEASPKSP